MLILFLAPPVFSYAGTVASRWDISIGGFVKFDGGWASQGVNGDYLYASPESITGNKNVVDEYGNSFMASGETRLNFAIKGPNAWGAKTSAFIEGDFRQSGAYEGFRLRHAWLKFDWAKTSLLIGQASTKWKGMTTYNVLGISELAMAKTNRVPQIMFTTKFTKNWSLSYGIVSQYKSNLAGGSRAPTGIPAASNTQRLNDLPFVESELVYKTDTYGKIGPRPLTLAFGGFIGRDKIARRSGVAGTQWYDDDANTWGLAFKGFIPVIPEKKGNKAGSLAFTGTIVIGQGSSTERYPSDVWDAYVRRASITATDFDAANATNSAGWAELTYYFTDSIYASAVYGTSQWNLSSTIRNDATYMNSNYPRSVQHYVVNLMYDVNQAIRFGVEYTHINTAYARAQAAGSGGASGSLDVGRVAAWYFF